MGKEGDWFLIFVAALAVKAAKITLSNFGKLS